MEKAAKKYDLIKITKHYVLDKESRIIFLVDTKNGKDVKNFTPCCKMVRDASGKYKAMERKEDIAIGVIEKASKLCIMLEEK